MEKVWASQNLADVRPSPVAGNGLFAKRAIDAGEQIIVKSHPLISVLDLAQEGQACANCFRPSQELGQILSQGLPENGLAVDKVNACTGCKKAKYCGKVCLIDRLLCQLCRNDIKRSTNPFDGSDADDLRDIAMPGASMEKGPQAGMQDPQGPPALTKCCPGNSAACTQDDQQ